MRNKSAKNIILDTASTLFYERGFLGTSLEEIATRCDVTKPAIMYHFGSKSQLGMDVTYLYMTRQIEGFRRVAQRSEDEIDDLVILAAQTMWMPRLLKEDRCAGRFYKEFISQSEYFKEIAKEQEIRYLENMIENAIEPLEERIKKISGIYAGKGLLDCFLDEVLKCTTEEFSYYFFLNYFRPFFDGENTLEEVYHMARTFIESNDIEALPYFVIA